MGTFRALHAQGNSVTSKTYADLLKNSLHSAIKSIRRGRLSTGVLLKHDNPRPHIIRSTVAITQDFPFSVFHIRRTRQTSTPVTFMYLDRSKRRWDARLSGPTERSSKRCKSACTLNQNFFLEVCMHFLSAGTLEWNAMDAALKMKSCVLLCSTN
jgi:hypothetical protein